MMIAEDSVVVRASLDRVRDAVLDPDAYLAGGTKVSQIHLQERTPDGMVARIDGSFGPFRSSILARYTVHPDHVDLQMVGPARLRGFHAVFLFEEEPGGVRLTHREEYDFGYPLVTPLVERLMRGWAKRSVTAEVNALKSAAEAPRPPGP
ncbi:MAG: type II toxin-antitoxin system RatA family toxin [Candidatus Dormibacterales bacterium]